jgi:hypothetical protein
LRRRGSFLLCIGAVWITHGFGILTGTRERFQGFGGVLGPIVNHPYWGWGWIAAGVVGCWFAFRRVGDDGPGFIATQLPPLLWWLFYTISWILSLFGNGDSRDWIIAAIWAVVLFAVYLVSGWPDAPAEE